MVSCIFSSLVVAKSARECHFLCQVIKKHPPPPIKFPKKRARKKMFLLCRLQRRTTWQLPTSEPPRSSFCTPRSEQSPSAWLVPFSPSTPGPGTPSWSSSSSSTSLSPSRCSNFPCPTPCWPPSRRCWRRPSTRLTRRLTFSFIFFYLFSENHVQVHIAFIANFHILNSVTTTAMIAVCALVQFLTADLHFEWNRVYVHMLSVVRIQMMLTRLSQMLNVNTLVLDAQC